MLKQIHTDLKIERKNLLKSMRNLSNVEMAAIAKEWEAALAPSPSDKKEVQVAQRVELMPRPTLSPVSPSKGAKADPEPIKAVALKPKPQRIQRV